MAVSGYLSESLTVYNMSLCHSQLLIGPKVGLHKRHTIIES